MPNGPLILAVDLRNPPKGGGYGRTHGPTHCFIYIDDEILDGKESVKSDLEVDGDCTYIQITSNSVKLNTCIQNYVLS